MGTASKIVTFVNKILNPYGLGFKEAQFNIMYNNNEANAFINFKDIKNRIPIRFFNIDDDARVFSFFITLINHKEKRFNITAYDFLPQLNINAIKSYVTKMKTVDGPSSTGFYSQKLYMDNVKVDADNPDQIVETLIKHIGEQIETYKKRIADIEDFLEEQDLQTFADEIKRREEEILEKATSLKDYKEKYYKNLKLIIDAKKDFQ
jgi:hypothetical protein